VVAGGALLVANPSAVAEEKITGLCVQQFRTEEQDYCYEDADAGQSVCEEVPVTICGEMVQGQRRQAERESAFGRDHSTAQVSTEER
jgi:hypothetical protein